MDKKEDPPQTKWRPIAAVFILISLILFIFVIVLAVLLSNEISGRKEPTPCCTPPPVQESVVVTEPDNPGIFDDLTSKELASVQKFLYSDKKLNLVLPAEAAIDKSHVFTMDLYLPSKSDSLNYLDKGGAKPAREALVVVFRGDKTPKVVEEYIVGPLPNPVYIKMRLASNRPNPIHFNNRPVSEVEYVHLDETLLLEIAPKLKPILEESYGAGLIEPVCGNKCLKYYGTFIGSGVSGINDRRMWLVFMHPTEYYVLHPIGFSLLVNLNATHAENYTLDSILYNGQSFNSVDEFVTKYNAGQVTKHVIPFPDLNRDMYSTSNLRGDPMPSQPKRAPRLFEPDGKRYTLRNRYVEYMKWKFNFRMDVVAGPQLYDVRFNNERIAYEIGMQETAVIYGGHFDDYKITDYMDSGELLGIRSHALVPGSDCPETSSFVDGFFLKEYTETPKRLPKMFCIFEENSGFPLRRHQAYEEYEGQFYSGMLDSALVVRSILEVVNYDYIIDYVFHQNGAVHIRVASTGYIYPSFYTPDGPDYGFRIHEQIRGNIHHHLFSFKIDLDIRGTSNRYETLDVTPVEVPNEQSGPGATYWQTKFYRNLKNSEVEAAYKFNFNEPKYHLVHNDANKTRYGAISGYRINLNGISYQPLPANEGNEATYAWARYQMAVTKMKDTERSSSSAYGMVDSIDPVVNFTTFLADDESLVDQDLVAWASIGIHHIPHTEDLPITPTTGTKIGIYLLPYNYFQECPATSSRDSIRLEPRDREKMSAGVLVSRYGYSLNNTCAPKPIDLQKDVGDKPEVVFEQ